jgi:hypothetical protein
MVVAGTAHIGVVEERGGAAVLGGGMVRLAAEEGGDALAIEDAQARAQLDGSGPGLGDRSSSKHDHEHRGGPLRGIPGLVCVDRKCVPKAGAEFLPQNGVRFHEPSDSH